jgi:HAD superfamily hydrolase (TIGR01509 family)
MHSSTYIEQLTKCHGFVDVPPIDVRPALVIFDCDGVLVQSEEITLGVLADLFNGQRSPNQPPLTSDDCIRRFRGRQIQACLTELEDQYRITLPSYFEAALRAQALSRYRTDLHATEGIHKVVSQLDTQFCVASSAPRSKIEHCLRLTGLWPWFEGKVFSCYELGQWKPDPLIFQIACASYHVDPDQALVIEDSIPGVQAAVAAGIRVLGFGPPQRHQELCNAGAIPFSRMYQLLDLIG